jgi:hypothetical protein
MNARLVACRVIVAIGLVAMVVGAVDPLEGSFIILPGVGVVALGAFIQTSRNLKLLCWAVALVTFGMGAMVALSAWGGLGGNSGHSMWWAVFILPYPVGWLMGLVGAVRTLVESGRIRMAGV